MRSPLKLTAFLGVLCWHTAAVHGAEAAPADDGWLIRGEEVDPDQGLRSCHPRAEALEDRLASLAPGDAERAALARELVDLYRWQLGHFSRAAFWVRTMADELRPTPEGIDALFELADTLFNHGRIEEALAVYKEILKRIMAPEPPWDSRDERCWPAWHGEKLCREAAGTDPLFRTDLTVTTTLGRFLQLARASSPSGAAAILDRSLDLRTAVQQSREPNVWTSARVWLDRAIGQLGEPAVRRLEQHYLQQIPQIAATQDWRQLAALRFQHPLPGFQREIDSVIGDMLLDAGMPALAGLFCGRARQELEEPDPVLLAKELFCRAHAGDRVPPGDVPDVQVEIAGQKRPLAAWLQSWQRAPAVQDERAGGAVDIEQSEVSVVPLSRAREPLRAWQLQWNARSDPEVPDYAPEFIAKIPAGTAGSMVINSGDVIEAIDTTDGTRLWSFLAPEENSMTFPNQGYEAKKHFIECARARTAVLTGDRVYCHLAWGHHDTRRAGSGLFALRRSDGSLIWSSLSIPELAALDIAADPAVHRGVVVAVAWRQRETLPPFYVVGIAAETGELLWMNYLYSGSSLTICQNEHFLDRPLACGPPAVADGVAYLTTGAGVAAAVSVVDGTLLWAVEYPRVRAINASTWAIRSAVSRPAGIIAVVGDVVLFAPIDSHVLLAVDRRTGQIRYMRESLDLQAIAAADADRAYLVEGMTVRAIEPDSGRTVWRRCLTASGLLGLPTLSDRGLWCPSWEALHLLNPASGEVLTRRAWGRDQACGYIRDGGDRLVGASRAGLHVLAESSLETTGKAAGETRDATIPARPDKWLRWVLPAVNRGDFMLSPRDPGHALIRSELIQMRSLDPVPALRWERPSPLDGFYEAAFDSSHVAVWDAANLFVLDATSGRTIWQEHCRQVVGPALRDSILLGEDDLVWWGPHSVTCYDIATGTQLWTITVDGTIRGVRLLDREVGAYVEQPGPKSQSAAHTALVLDRTTGQEKARFAMPRPEPVTSPVLGPSGKPMRLASLDTLVVGRSCVRYGDEASDVVLTDGRLPVRVDWARRTAVAGEAIAPFGQGLDEAVRLDVGDGLVCLKRRDDDSPRYHEVLMGLWDAATLARLDRPDMPVCAVAGNRLYGFAGHRIQCLEPVGGRQIWRSLALLDEPREIIPIGEHLLVLTQDWRFNNRDIRDVSCVRVFDINTGEHLKDVNLPKRWMHVVVPREDGLVMWDCTWLYRVRAPARSAPVSPDSGQSAAIQADVDAIAAVKMAADLEDPPQVAVAPLAQPLRIDADLSDWSDVPAKRLETLMDWKPDFVHRSLDKRRSYGGAQDLSAVVRVGRAGGTFCLAAEVVDDIHLTNAAPGLWRSDSLTLWLARGGDHEAHPTLLTVGLVDGAPRFEFGTAVRTLAVSDPPGSPFPTGPGPRTFVLPAVADPTAEYITPGESLEVAICRDERTRTTVYEMRINGATFTSLPDLYWDVLIHDNDGLGREGALQLASSVWGVEETPIGAIAGMK